MKHFAIIFLLASALCGCNSDFTPKPRGYFRIDLPQKAYQKFDTTFPFTFEYPVYAKIVKDSSRMGELYWFNIVYTPFNAQLHFSYKVITNNLKQYLDDSRTLVNKHIPKANAIQQREYLDPANKVYGLVFDIKGSDAASTYQFYLTDSVAKFVRGALYFNLVPNNDSLQPVIGFLKEDIEHMIATFRWKSVK
ncbi:MAG: gliding motility lipoprotein GldD [Bacteroidetes bacterium]|nr:gliding motility lipoprotein GldD [Bacteroidota bacterium]